MRYWVCQIVGWGGWSIIQIAAVRLSGSLTLRSAALSLTMAATALAVTHLLRSIIKRQGWLDRRPKAWFLVSRLGAASVAAGICSSLLVWAEMIWVGGTPAAETSFRYFLLGVVSWTAIIALWLALYAGVKMYQRSRTAESAARTAQLDTLRAQLNPHFLFNALNSIRALIAEDPARAQNAVTELASLLRYTLYTPASSLAPLREELDAVRHYLRIEQIRHEDRLRVEESVEPAALEARLPPMLLQTLVENGIKHGVARVAAGGTLAIRAAISAAGLRLTVTNPGQLGNGTGIGLRNARERLALLAPGSSLRLDETAAGVRATVEIPQ